MPKDTKTKSGGVAGDKKPSSQWRGLPSKLRAIPNSEQLFSMWGNDSFRRAPPVVPTNSSIWDAKDPSRPLPYSFQIPPPIAPPPIAGIAFVTHARAARSKPPAKQTRAQLLPALHPSSHSFSYDPSCSSTIVPSVPTQSFLYPYRVPSPSLRHPGSVSSLSWPPPPKEEPMVEELPHANYVSDSEQGYRSEHDDFSPGPSLCSVSRTGSPSTTVATPPPPSSPPLRPWSSPGETCLSPLMLGERLSVGDLAKSSPTIARARSDPPEKSSQSRGEEALSVYEACRQRRLPPMNFKKPAASSTALDLPGNGLVLPALRVHSSDPDRQGSVDEGRDFDASLKPERTPRHSPYHITNASRGAHKENETDLPPLRLLLDQLEIDEHRRTQSESQSETTLADKLLILQAPAKKRSSATPSRRRRAVKTAESATPVPTLRVSLSAVAARVAPRHPGPLKLGTVSGSGVVNPCTAGGRAAAAVHPQRGGLHAL